MPYKIALLLHNVRSAQNVGSIMRSADCFGVSYIYFSGYTPYPIVKNDPRLPHLAKKIHNRIAKTALGAEEYLAFSIHSKEIDAINIAKKAGFNSIICLEQDKRSIPINQYTPDSNMLLIVGNELSGVSNWTRQNANVILEITQYGKKESLNVSNATAIALYALTAKQL